jgi:simple sugar transport system ATP-binding protein
VKAPGAGAAARSLSGGNLQKFIVGREIRQAPRVMIAAQPTWGVDVGASAQIRQALLDLRDAGCAVLVVSEELDELFEICDRLAVIAHGALSDAVPIAQTSAEAIGLLMSDVTRGVSDAARAGADATRVNAPAPREGAPR